MRTGQHPGVGAAALLGLAVGLGGSVAAGGAAVAARARVRELEHRSDELRALDIADPATQRLRDARLAVLRFEQTSPRYMATFHGRASVAGALLAVGSLTVAATTR